MYEKAAIVMFVVAALMGCDGALLDDVSEDAREQSLVEELGQPQAELLFAGERVVLDAEGLTGHLEGVRPNTDAARVVVLDAHPEGLDLEGARVLDARVVDDGVVTLGADRVLRHHNVSETTELDRDVLGPVSVAAGRVAYVRGEAPDLELAVLTLETGDIERVATKFRPAWSPALSEDGAEVAFAAVDDSRPQLFVLDPSGQLHRLNARGRTPSSPVAPRWRGGTLTFQDEYGTVRVDVEDRTPVNGEVTR